MKTNPFLDVMRQHSDEELLQILNVKRTDYVADAIAAAEEVLGERGVIFEKKPDEVFEQKDTSIDIESIKASMGIRLLGYIIDSVVIVIIAMVVLSFAEAAGNVVNVNILCSALIFLYYIVLECADGHKTLGKRIYNGMELA